MSDLLQPGATGIALGAMYALCGVAFVIVHNVTGVINFATGEYVMIGAMVATTAVAAGLPLPVVFVLATASAAAMGGVAERLTIRPLRGATVLTLILVTIGVSIALQGAALLIWGVSPRRYNPFTAGGPFDLGGVTFSRQSLWVLGLTVFAALSLRAFFATTVGKAMRACEMQPEAARLQGISPSRMSLYSFTIAGALAGSAGMVFVPITSASYAMGLPLALKGFIAAVIGGLVSPLGAIVGGLLLGVAEAYSARYLSSSLKDAIAFGLLFLVIVARPRGLLVLGEASRV